MLACTKAAVLSKVSTDATASITGPFAPAVYRFLKNNTPYLTVFPVLTGK